MTSLMFNVLVLQTCPVTSKIVNDDAATVFLATLANGIDVHGFSMIEGPVPEGLSARQHSIMR